MIRIEMKAGHGAGKPTSKIVCHLNNYYDKVMYFYELFQIDETADIYAFMAQTLGMSWTD